MGNCPGVSQALCVEVCWGETAPRRWGRRWGRDPLARHRKSRRVGLNLPRVSPRRRSAAGAGGAQPAWAEPRGAERRTSGFTCTWAQVGVHLHLARSTQR